MNDQLSPRMKEDMQSLLFKLIRIPSLKDSAVPGAPFGQETRHVLEVFLEEASALGFRTKNMEGYCGWAEIGPEDGPLVMGVCHLDVVPALGWDDAYEPRLEEDRIVGRGSIDDKGPAVSVLYALKALMDEGYQPQCRLRLLVGLDEESGSACMRYYNEHGEAPVAAFTSDADYPVIHAEKGHLNAVLTWQGSQAPKNLLQLEAGSRPNVIPGECRISFRDEDGQVQTQTIEGRMGHASTPWLSENAISKAIHHLDQKIDHPFLKDYMSVIGLSYSGEGLQIAGSDQDSGPLTLNVGIIAWDAEAEEAKVTIDIRYPVTWDAEELEAKLQSSLVSTAFTYERLSLSPPLFRAKTDPLVTLLQSIYNRYTGEATEPIAIGGGTYARSVPNCLAFGPCFPGEESLAHQKGEYITLHAFYGSTIIYRETFRKLSEHYGTQTPSKG